MDKTNKLDKNSKKDIDRNKKEIDKQAIQYFEKELAKSMKKNGFKKVN